MLTDPDAVAQTIPPFLRELTTLNTNNFEFWLDFDWFITWTTQYYQQNPQQSLDAQVTSSMPISVPISSKHCVSLTQQSLDMQVASTPILTSIATKYRVSPTQQSLSTQAASLTPILTPIPSKHRVSVTLDNLFSHTDSINFLVPRTPARTPKRKHSTDIGLVQSEVIDIDDSDGDLDHDSSPTKCFTTKRLCIKKEPTSAEIPANPSLQANVPLQITQQLTLRQLILITTIPSCWMVPWEEQIGYLLDLSDNDRQWNNSEGKPMSMAAIIKSQVCWVISIFLTLDAKQVL
jgi:hypothetical protein